MIISKFIDENMRTKILEYDINNSENTVERDLWYIQSSEEEILYNCINCWFDELEELGFNGEDLELMKKYGFEIEVTDGDFYILMRT